MKFTNKYRCDMEMYMDNHEIFERVINIRIGWLVDREMKLQHAYLDEMMKTGW